MRFTKITNNVVYRPAVFLHRRSFSIWALGDKRFIVDVCLNKWIFSRKVLVSFWFDRDNRCGRAEAAALVS